MENVKIIIIKYLNEKNGNFHLQPRKNYRFSKRSIIPFSCFLYLQFSQCDYRLNGNNKILESSKTKDVFIYFSYSTSRFLVRLSACLLRKTGNIIVDKFL